MCTAAGLILGIALTAGQTHDSKAFEPLVSQVLEEHCVEWPDALAGDKGYSYHRIRQFLENQGIEAVIPTRKDQERDPSFDISKYRKRSRIEQVNGWIKEHRAVATRYEKLATHFQGTVHVALIDHLLRHWADRTAPIAA